MPRHRIRLILASAALVALSSTTAATSIAARPPVGLAAVAERRGSQLRISPEDAGAYPKVKALADKLAGISQAAPVANSSTPATAAGPAAGAGWDGVYNGDTSPGDPNGAIGPTRYVEVVNSNIGIYDRTGAELASGTLGTLTHDTAHGLSDPMVLWGPATNRFYFNVLDVDDYTMRWGFSKTDSPLSLTDFCYYKADFGYGAQKILPDYPKLGQTADFLLLGINAYGAALANGSDIAWISKPQGLAPVTTCPAVSTFKKGVVSSLKNADGSLAWTPIPAIQTDPSGDGWIVAGYDVGGSTQIDLVGSLPTADFLTLFKVTKNADGTPNIPVTGTEVPVAAYQAPANAPQQKSPFVLDTLDGRLTHAVSGVDPLHGDKTAVWTTHAVFGGAGVEQRWYEIDTATSSVIQSGVATSSSLSVFNGSISPDRAVHLQVNPDGTITQTAQFGGTMFLDFNTSGVSQYPSIQMLDKTGDQPQSDWTMVKQSAGQDADFTCLHAYVGVPRVSCRWGDYSGATPDPTPAVAPGATAGSVWMTSPYVTGEVALGATWRTWNWAASLPA